jgi:hypothetical protein
MMRVLLFLIVLLAMLICSASSSGHCYVSDELDFAPMGEEQAAG